MRDDWEPWRQVLHVCPSAVRARLEQLPLDVVRQVEEIRFRLGQPVHLCGGTLDHFVHPQEGLTRSSNQGVRVTEEDLSRIMQIVTQASMYAVQEELRRGFVTMPGGHRVGVGGHVVVGDNGRVRTIRNITSINVRIAREHPGAAERLRAAVVSQGTPLSTLIISPPQCGKTTLLRDLARQWSLGWPSIRPCHPVKVAVVDERSEIAGCLDGVPQFELGPRTDVLDACPKADGMLMAIRSLSPQVVVTDEIGRSEDRDAILEATHAGVVVIASAHANSLEDWRRRPSMAELFETRAFQRFIILSRRRGPGTIEAVLDDGGMQLPLSHAGFPDRSPREG
ncbi:MAG: stage III sporulation protein AA [Alicyclobacillus sp.]|nr:stage III sporulation protein AA [Alicyclobacillus sp.]